MEKKVDYRRCGECGKSFNKSEWLRVNRYCPNCEKYICLECITRMGTCPVCDTTIKNTYDALIYTSLLMGILFIPFVIIIPLLGDYGFTILTMFGTMILSFIVASFTYFAREKRREKHVEYLSKLPSGIIPAEDRPGYGLTSTTLTSVEKSFWPSTFPETYYIGLVGDWNPPILSREEKEMAVNNTVRQMIYGGYSAIVIFVLFFVFSIWLFFNIVIIAIVFGLLLVGFLLLGGAYYLKGGLKKDKITESRVLWKSVGHQTTIDTIEEFLKQHGEEYQKKVDNWDKKGWFTIPVNNYIFKNGNYISTRYPYDEGIGTYAFVSIGYTSEHYNHAREIQSELDDFLGERDLIYRR
ncbi:MAG: hypothetical protein JSW00_08870 [Thermoplasmata archaeon]|nr:MAG: hypothetical protein JSW00_08870 [Thermoplasmata archaeon]